MGKHISYFLLFTITMYCFTPSYGGVSVMNNDILQNAEPQNNRKTLIHIAAKGESVSSILKSYNMSLEKFLKANKQLQGTDLTLSLGQRLIINKKDIGSSNDAAINHELKVYLASRGIEAKPVELLPAEKVEQAQVMHKLEIIKKYDERTAPKTLEGGINVAILLPITHPNGTIDKDYEAFYKGAVLAMDSLKKSGVSMNVDVYDTGKELDVINNLLAHGTLMDRHLIIGPIYNDQFSAVADYAKQKDITIVSPLAAVDANNDCIYQVAPSQNTRYDKAKEYLKGKRVIFFSNGTEEEDKSFANMVLKSSSDVHNIKYNVNMKEPEIISYFSKEVPNVVVISTKKKADIELLLSKIAAVRATYYNYKIAVLGSPEFSKMDDDKKSDFFRTDTHFVTSYHQDRLNEKSLSFETKYVDMFGELPNLYSYRAYDVMMTFGLTIDEIGFDFAEELDNQLTKILQVNYRFKQERENGKSVNQEWMIVNYKPNYTITTK